MYTHYGKRLLDIIGAVVLLVIAAVPMLIVTIIIKLDSHGPALFRHQRYGKDKQPFTIYKFRSMAIDAPNDRATQDFHDSHMYITKVGRIMRKLSIDELPQLINVLRGDMSLIGPRPVVLSEKRLIKLRDNYGANSVKPGITGWAQANGRDEMDDVTKSDFDGYYANHLGLVMDAKVILKTLYVIVTGAGHAEGHERMPGKKDDKLVAGE